MIGKHFGKLTVDSLAYSRNHSRYWKCICDCGGVVNVKTKYLNNGDTKSCGCLKSESNKSRATHGMTHTTEYHRWASMIQRCTRKDDKQWENYGGRGIKVCDRWAKFENFYADMGSCPKGMQLDRIDNNKGYEPSNCRWTDIITQARNRRNNHIIDLNGISKTISEWSECTGIPYRTILSRIYKLNWSAEQTLTHKSKENDKCLNRDKPLKPENCCQKEHMKHIAMG